jgi:hypothetical protein
MGDGTIRKDNSIIYYSKSKKLADDVQELAMMCGYETTLYGPYKQSCNNYEIEMYQVYIVKTADKFKKCIRSHNIKKEFVENKKMVCFTVPNSTLVTRLNGRIGFHGNCKNAYHVIRLIKMAREIMTTGKVIVKRPDREELIAIRNGSWTYEQLIEWVEKEDKELEQIYYSSTFLPKSVDKSKIDELCIKLVEEFQR